MSSALDVVDLRKAYGGRVAVDGLSFSVPTGTVLALLGPNGAGKTTTVEVAEGFRRPDSGSVRVLGKDPRDPSLRHRVGVMPQSGGGYPGMPAGELLDLTAGYHREPIPPSVLVEHLALGDVLRTPWRRLSGGQQQRLSLAMAIVGRPDVLFLDEPTAGLDLQSCRATWDLVDALRRDGVTVLLTTHLMHEAERLADQVVVVDHGRVVAQGTVAELTRLGATSQVHVQAPPGADLASFAASLPGTTVREAAAGSYVVEGAVDPSTVARLTGWFAEQGLLVTSLRVEQRSLEDVFLELTGRELRT